MYEQEKTRADALQADMNNIDEQHYDECAELLAKIALLEQQLKMRRLH